jgi:hypothetical protein
MKRGIRFVPLAVALALAAPGASVAASGPVYETTPAPIYSPAPPTKPPRIRFDGLRLNWRSGRAAIFVRVDGPGRLVLHGRGVRRLARVAKRERQRVRLPVKPKVRLAHYLKRHGKARIRVEVTFRPDGGIPKTIEKVVVLRRKVVRNNPAHRINVGQGRGGTWGSARP